MNKETRNVKLSEKTVNVPILNIRQLTDEEWNQLARRNALKGRAVSNG